MLYEQVKKEIAADIRNGRYPVDTLLPPPQVLAKESGYALTTMRRALLELGRDGVLKGVQRLGTVVVRRPAQARLLLLLAPDDHTNLLIHRPLEEAFAQAEYDVDAISWAGGPEQMNRWCDRLLRESNPPDCLVAINGLGNLPKHLTDAFSRRVSLTLDGVATGAEQHEVAIDPAAEAQVLAQHVLSAGHRHVAIWSGHHPNQKSVRPRLVGDAFCDQLAAAGVRGTRYYTADGFDGLISLIRTEGVSAYIDTNDFTAVLTMMQLYRCGLRLPEDISIIGRHDTLWAVETKPPLTSLSLHPQGMAEATVGAVQAALADEPPRIHRVAPYIVVRDSTRSLI